MVLVALCYNSVETLEPCEVPDNYPKEIELDVTSPDEVTDELVCEKFMSHIEYTDEEGILEVEVMWLIKSFSTH